jgi:hypothetical protein
MILFISIIVYIASLFLRPLFFDVQPVTPKNIFLLSYALKLVVVPVTLLVFGFVDNPIYNSNAEIGYGVYVNVVSYLSLSLGFIFFSRYFNLFKLRQTIVQLDKKILLSRTYIIGLFLLVVLFSLFYRFYNTSLADLIIKNQDELKVSENPLPSFISNIGRFAFPFLVILLLGDQRLLSKNVLLRLFAWVSLFASGIIATIGSNRASLLYMAVSIVALFSIKVKRIPFYLIIIAILIAGPYIVNFNQARVSSDIDTFNETLKEVDQESILATLQVYFQAPQTVINLNERNESKDHFTLFNSFFESFPYLGKDLRNKSGSYYYNMYIYHSDISRDQVYPFAAEIEKNLGPVGIILTFFLFGNLFGFLNSLYLSSIKSNSPSLIIFSIIYASIYLNAVNLLSVSVLGQFLFYNSFPIVVIFILSKTSRIRE